MTEKHWFAGELLGTCNTYLTAKCLILHHEHEERKYNQDVISAASNFRITI